FFYRSAATRDLHSFPTRRSSDLNAVMPGLMATAMTVDVPQAVSDALLGSVPLGRAASTADVAATVRFLLGAESAYLSGVEIAVRSEEHTSELQSLAYLVCRLLLE